MDDALTAIYASIAEEEGAEREAADSAAERGLTHSAHPSASMMRTRTSTDAPRT